MCFHFYFILIFCLGAILACALGLLFPLCSGISPTSVQKTIYFLVCKENSVSFLSHLYIFKWKYKSKPNTG